MPQVVLPASHASKTLDNQYERAEQLVQQARGASGATSSTTRDPALSMDAPEQRASGTSDAAFPGSRGMSERRPQRYAYHKEALAISVSSLVLALPGSARTLAKALPFSAQHGYSLSSWMQDPASVDALLGDSMGIMQEHSMAPAPVGRKGSGAGLSATSPGLHRATSSPACPVPGQQEQTGHQQHQHQHHHRRQGSHVVSAGPGAAATSLGSSEPRRPAADPGMVMVQDEAPGHGRSPQQQQQQQRQQEQQQQDGVPGGLQASEYTGGVLRKARGSLSSMVPHRLRRRKQLFRNTPSAPPAIMEQHLAGEQGLLRPRMQLFHKHACSMSGTFMI